MLFFLFHRIFTFFSKTLISVELGNNQIGDKGAEHLANALQQNKVTGIVLFCSYPIIFYYFSQTLTTLDLYNNRIGFYGGQHLADALEQNKVTRMVSVFFLCNHSFNIFLHRH